MRAWCFTSEEIRLLCGVILLACCGCGALEDALGPEELAALDQKVSTYPTEVQRGYALFRTRCSNCHSIAQPLSGRVRPNRWTGMVRRMARKPASGIRREEILPIVSFLEYHFREEAKK